MAEDFSLSLKTMGLELPFSQEAEQAILGCVIADRTTAPQVVETLRYEYFYLKQNGDIFTQIVSLFMSSTPIDYVTLYNKVVENNVFSTADDAKQYLAKLAESVPSVANLDNYIKIVEEKYLIRTLMSATKEILDRTKQTQDAKVLLEFAEQSIYDIRRGRDQSGMQPIKSVIVDTLQHLQLISGPDKDKYTGIKSGFHHLDRMLTGLGRSDLIILAARPGMGKTSFALNIATNVAKKEKIPVAIFSLEMTKDQLVTRMLSSEAGVDSHSLRTGSFQESDWADLARASEIMSQTTIYLDDTSNITVPEIKAKVRRINQDPQKQDIGLVVIDYLQLMNTGGRSNNRVQEISEITRNLKIMAKELNVPVITLSQLSRQTERGNSNNHRPTLSDLRDSGSIEQDADSVLFLLRESYYDSEGETNENQAVCIVAKNRHGEVGDVALGWDGAHTRFINVEYGS